MPTEHSGLQVGYLCFTLYHRTIGLSGHQGLSDTIGLITRLINDPSALVASSALRITVNYGLGSYYGEKYNVDKVHEFEFGGKERS